MSEKRYLFLSLLTLFTVLAWIFFDAYHAFITSTVPEDLQAQIAPFNSKLDQKILDYLKARQEKFLSLPSVPQLPLSPKTTQPQSTQSAQLEPLLPSTSSGELP